MRLAITLEPRSLSAAVVRYRAYSEKGLNVGEIGVLVAFCSFTFALGASIVGGFCLLSHPELAERIADAPLWLGQAVGVALVGGPSLYVVGAFLHFPPIRVGAHDLVYPRPSIAARQLLAGPLELIGATGIVYFALPAAANPGFLVVLGVFVASFSIALISHAPGRPRRPRIHVSPGDAGRAAGQCRRGLAGVPSAISDPAAYVRADRRSGL